MVFIYRSCGLELLHHETLCFCRWDDYSLKPLLYGTQDIERLGVGNARGAARGKLAETSCKGSPRKMECDPFQQQAVGGGDAGDGDDNMRAGDPDETHDGECDPGSEAPMQPKALVFVPEIQQLPQSAKWSCSSQSQESIVLGREWQREEQGLQLQQVRALTVRGRIYAGDCVWIRMT